MMMIAAITSRQINHRFKFTLHRIPLIASSLIRITIKITVRLTWLFTAFLVWIFTYLFFISKKNIKDVWPFDSQSKNGFDECQIWYAVCLVRQDRTPFYIIFILIIIIYRVYSIQVVG